MPRTAVEGQGLLGGLAVGAALTVLAALLGEVRATPGVLLALLLLGALGGAFAVTRKWLLRAAGGLALLLAGALLTPVLRVPLAALTVSQAPVPADVIVVLGSGVHCGTATQSATSLARLTRGLELWRAGYAPRLTLSEPAGTLGPPGCPKLDRLQAAQIRALLSPGPPLLTLRNVGTTRDEAARVHELSHRYGWKRVLLVTSPWHSRRAAALFQAPGIEVVSVPASEPNFDLTLPLPSDRLGALRVVIYESLSRLKARLSPL